MTEKLIKLFLAAFLPFIILGSCKRDKANETVLKEDQFRISGRIDGFGSGYLVGSVEKSIGEPIVRDTIFVTNDSFDHIIEIEERDVLSYFVNSFSAKNREEKPTTVKELTGPRDITFVAIPGTSVTVSGKLVDYLDAYPSGDEENNRLAAMSKKIKPLDNERKKLRAIRKEMKRENNTDSVASLTKRIDQLFETASTIEDSFHMANPSSTYTSRYLFGRITHRENYISKEVDSLYKRLDTSSTNKYYKKAKALLDKKRKFMEGKAWPDFTSSLTLDGKPLSTESLRGKYVLIDFWGVWCAPCVRELPMIQDYYNKHRHWLEVVGINYRDTEEKWRDFLEKNGYDWIHIKNGKGTENIVENFEIMVFPTKFLIDPQGTILHGTNSERDIFELLDQLSENQ